MRKLVLMLALLMTGNAFAQQTKKVRRESPQTAGLTEEFEVLKSDKATRHGVYLLKMSYSGRVMAKGFYKNNLRDSLWTYHDFRDSVIGQGYYKNDKRVGIWEYKSNGEVTDRFDFDSGKVLFHKPGREAQLRYQVINNKDTTITRLEREPIYTGSSYGFQMPLLTGVRYPRLARERGISGEVIVAFTVDEQGHARDYHIAKSLGYGCDEEVLNIIKKTPDDWFPGILDGKPVTAIVRVPFKFNLEGSR